MFFKIKPLGVPGVKTVGRSENRLSNEKYCEWENEERLGPPSPLLFTRGVTIFWRRFLQAERLDQAKYCK